MSSFLQLLLALPEILRLVNSILSRVKDAQKQHRVKNNLKEEIKVINAAFKDGDPLKLDELWTSNNQNKP